MMSRGNEPIHPWGEHGTVLGGMTLREHYAGLAMMGMLARRAVGDGDDKALIAALADGYALALLKQQAKDPTP
jgi:hypothetical protein